MLAGVTCSIQDLLPYTAFSLPYAIRALAIRLQVTNSELAASSTIRNTASRHAANSSLNVINNSFFSSYELTTVMLGEFEQTQ